MQTSEFPYEKQIFVCTCFKDEGKPCCGAKGGDKIFRQLRDEAVKRGLHPKIRIAQATCLGQCAKGINLMTESEWVSEATLDDVPELIEKYLA